MIKLLSSVLKPLSAEDKKFKQQLKNLLGFSPGNISLYEQAFRHSSAKNEINSLKPSNERMEFLGDAILGAVIADYLFKMFPTQNEGYLTQVRSRLVNGNNLQTLSKKFGLDAMLKSRLTKKEKITSSAYGDVFEAFIGAIYLDKGFDTTKQFILNKVVKNHLDMNEVVQNNTDYKTQFQILMQRQKKSFKYTLLSEAHNGKEKLFKVELSIDGIAEATFEHKSKKVAEQRVAQLTLEKLGISL